MVEEDEKRQYLDKIKCVTTTSYKHAVDILSHALNRKARPAAHLKTAFYEPSQSHIFITLEIIQFLADESQAVKSVLTLIDLAGFTPELDPETLQTMEPWVNKSLECLRQYLLNVDLHKYKQYSFTSDSKSVLTQLMKQNFLNDFKITIIGTLPHFEDTSINRTALVKTLTFCNKFKNIVGRLLYLSTEQEIEESLSAESSIVDLPPKIEGLGKKVGVSFCTNASTERQLHLKPSILILNKALRISLRKCLDCHGVSAIVSGYVINKTLEQLNINLDEKLVDFNIKDVDIQKLQMEIDQNLDTFLSQIEGKIGSPDDCKTRGEIEKLAQSISKLLFQAIAKMCCLKRGQVPENAAAKENTSRIEKILHNNICLEESKKVALSNSKVIKEDDSSAVVAGSIHKCIGDINDNYDIIEEKHGKLLSRAKSDPALNSASKSIEHIPSPKKLQDHFSNVSKFSARGKDTSQLKHRHNQPSTSGVSTFIQKSDEKNRPCSGLEYLHDSLKEINKAFKVLKKYFEKEKPSGCLICSRPKKKKIKRTFLQPRVLEKPIIETEVTIPKVTVPEEKSKASPETARFGLEKCTKAPEMTFSRILEDVDRPILEFDDTKARLQNIAIIGANIVAKPQPKAEPQRGDETPKQISIEELEEEEKELRNESIEIDLGSDIDEYDKSSTERVLHSSKIEILYDKEEGKQQNETTEYINKSPAPSILTFSVQDSPVPRVPDSDSKMLYSAQQPFNSPNKSVARKLFGDIN